MPEEKNNQASEAELKTNTASEREDRLRKLEELKKLGTNPYPAKVERDATNLEVLNNFEKLEAEAKVLNLVGRLRAKRAHGNLAFSNLQDESATIQVAFSKKEIGADEFKKFIKLVDVGDFIQVRGKVFLTHKGEKSLMVESVKILGKALRPIPDSWYGLKDSEDRYRRRYLDILLN